MKNVEVTTREDRLRHRRYRALAGASEVAVELRPEFSRFIDMVY
jgi:hypothetical protein